MAAQDHSLEWHMERDDCWMDYDGTTRQQFIQHVKEDLRDDQISRTHLTVNYGFKGTNPPHFITLVVWHARSDGLFVTFYYGEQHWDGKPVALAYESSFEFAGRKQWVTTQKSMSPSHVYDYNYSLRDCYDLYEYLDILSDFAAEQARFAERNELQYASLADYAVGRADSWPFIGMFS